MRREFAGARDHAKDHTKTGRHRRHPLVPQQFFETRRHPAAHRFCVRAVVWRRQKEKCLAQGEQTQHHDDQVHAGTQKRKPEGEALRIGHGIQSHGLQENAEHRQKSRREDLPPVGQYHQDDAQKGGQEDLATAEHGRDEGQHRRQQDQAKDAENTAPERRGIGQ